MTDEFGIVQTAIAEIVKKVSIDDGDILIVKTASLEYLQELAHQIDILHEDIGKDIRFLLVEQNDIDILREADEEMMRKLGWQKIK